MLRAATGLTYCCVPTSHTLAASEHFISNNSILNYINTLSCKGNYSATSHDVKLVYCRPLMGGLLHLVQRGGDWAGRSPPRPIIIIIIIIIIRQLIRRRNMSIKSLQGPILAVPNVTAHPSTINVLQSWYCCIMVRCFAVLTCP